jgi:hypothetical protein
LIISSVENGVWANICSISAFDRAGCMEKMLFGAMNPKYMSNVKITCLLAHVGALLAREDILFSI